MNPLDPDRRRWLAAGLLLGTAAVVPPVRACEVQADYLRVLHPWTRASAAEATSATVCMTLDQVTRPERLLGADTPVATGAVLVRGDAVLQLDLPVPVGHETVLGEEGLQLRLTGLTLPLQVGRVYPLHLRFQESGLVMVQLNVDFTATSTVRRFL